MVESICGQDFAYACEVEEERLGKLVKLGKKITERNSPTAEQISVQNLVPSPGCSFIGASASPWSRGHGF
jgi:hypothetical protein